MMRAGNAARGQDASRVFERAAARLRRPRRRCVPVRRYGHGDAALGRHARHELVKETEAADAEIEQRVAFARLDERREHTRRRLRRAHPDRMPLDQ